MMTHTDIEKLSPKELRELIDKLSPDDVDRLLDETAAFASLDDNAFDVYTPTVFALEYHLSTAKYRAYIAANRASKTFSSMVDVVASFIGRPPKTMQDQWPQHRIAKPMYIRWITVDTPHGIEKIALEMFKRICPKHEMADYSPSLMTATSKIGSKIEFMSYTMELKSFSGTKRDRIHFDEEPPESVYDENVKRIMGGGEISISMTPENGVTWSFDRLYQKASKRFVSAPAMPNDRFCPNREMKLQHIPDNEQYKIHTFHPTIYDNPHISREEIKDLLISYEGNDELRAISILGEFVSRTGLVYPEYNSQVHDYNPEKTILDPDWPRYVIIDPHPRTPWAVSLWCTDPKGTYFAEEELWLTGNLEQKAMQIRNMENRKLNGKPRWIVKRIIDPLACTPSPIDGTTIIDDLRKYNLHCQIANKDKSRGIELTKQALSYTRNNNHTIDKPPKIYFNKTLKHHKSEIANYIWEEWSDKTRHSKNEKQKPADKNDHFMENMYRFVLLNTHFIDKHHNKPLNLDKFRWAS